ncbi:MAG: sulfotransferase [Myxococcota bacterium]|nr:sulfotransferase [Myxococcota bacterium]
MLQYVVITGKGRSGTTWLAQILNSHPACCYKHEPFPERKRTPYADWAAELRADAKRTTLRAKFDEICRGCHHSIDLPPFPDKNFERGNPRILHGLHGLGSRVAALRWLYEAYGRPRLRDDTDILIKDVNFETALLPALCATLEPRLLATIRNPFANVASHLTGVARGIFESDRESDARRARAIIEAPGGEPYRGYLSELSTMPAAMFEALRWRIHVEPMVEVAEGLPRGRTVVYEDLCEDPLSETEQIFDFIGWVLTPATRDFIHASIAGPRAVPNSRRAYFSVFRDPRKSMNKWRDQLSPAEQSQIADVVRDSPLLDRWSDLPL